MNSIQGSYSLHVSDDAMEDVRENKIKFVDALRGFAILGVLIVHCGQIGTNKYSDIVQTVIINGAIGVQLFFVASAFTIFLTYENRHHKEAGPVINFFIRRFFRIAPMYYCGIIYFVWQEGFGPRYWLGDAAGVSLWNILSNIFFVHSLNPYWITSVVPGGWSIAVEVCFYCLVPFLFQKVRNLNQAVVLFLITSLLRMVSQWLLQHFPLIGFERLWGEYLFFYPLNQFPVFACGIILYFLIRSPSKEWRVEPYVAIALLLSLLAQLLSHTSFIFPLHIQFAMAFVGLGYILSRWNFLLLVNPVTTYLGKISYSMYLIHFALLHLLIRFNYVDFVPSDIPYFSIVNFSLRLCFLMPVTALLSTFTYYLIEEPFQKLGKTIVAKKESVVGKTRNHLTPESSNVSALDV